MRTLHRARRRATTSSSEIPIGASTNAFDSGRHGAHWPVADRSAGRDGTETRLKRRFRHRRKGSPHGIGGPAATFADRHRHRRHVHRYRFGRYRARAPSPSPRWRARRPIRRSGWCAASRRSSMQVGGNRRTSVAGLAHGTTVATNALLQGRDQRARPDRHRGLPPYSGDRAPVGAGGLRQFLFLGEARAHRAAAISCARSAAA